VATPSTPWHAKHPAASALALPAAGFPSAAIAATGMATLNATMIQIGIRIVVRFSYVSRGEKRLALAF
jgi:hypothetical protein